MKKINVFLSVVCILLFIVTLTNCSSNGKEDSASKEKKMEMHESNHSEGHDEHGQEMHKGENHQHKMINVAEIDKNKDGKVYQCPMCADQVSDEKGECSKCGMALEETTVQKAKENLENSKG